MRSFGGFIHHLTCHQTILLTSLGSFGLSFIIRTAIFASLGCWALIARALVPHFQQDDHLILLDVVAHVETNISLFHIAL